MIQQTQDATLFEIDYDFATMDAAVDEKLYEEFKKAIIAVIKDPVKNEARYPAQTMLVCLAANIGALAAACAVNEETACLIARRLNSYVHDIAHQMFIEKGDSVPPPNVPHTGNA